MSVYEISDTLVGPTIFYKKTEDSKFSLTINQSGILLSDGVGEIYVEIGEDGESGNSEYLSDVSSLSEREVSLIYEISVYQYNEFQRVRNEE